MPLGPNVISLPKTRRITVSLEPALNALNSMLLLNFTGSLSGLGSWVLETAEALTPSTLRRNQLMMSLLFDAIFVDDHIEGDFPGYLEYLASHDPVTLRDRVLNGLVVRSPSAPSAEQLLNDRDAYLAYVSGFDPVPDPRDSDLLVEAHQYLNHPDQMQADLVAHLAQMWDILAVEWEQVHSRLEETVAAFREVNLNILGIEDAFRTVTGRNIADELQSITVPGNIIFVPTTHIGPYVTLYEREDTLRICFGARMPSGGAGMNTMLDRTQLLVWLAAIADETRLGILEMIAREGEVCAQDIINHFALSQSSASRHLRQLRAAGYLTERRRDGANKCYTLNPERVEELRTMLGKMLA